jgi:hypothetical protein
MIKLAIILSLLTVTPKPSVEEESVLFDIVHKDRIVGVLKAVKRSNGASIIYENFTRVNTCIIKRIEMTYETKVVFENGEMVEANVITRVNGKLRACLQTRKTGSRYHFLKNGKMKKVVENPIRFSSIMLLFEEPRDVDYTYSEETGCFFKINPSGKLVYRKMNGRGKISTYSYSAQALQRIAIEGGLFNFEMILK